LFKPCIVDAESSVSHCIVCNESAEDEFSSRGHQVLHNFEFDEMNSICDCCFDGVDFSSAYCHTTDCQSRGLRVRIVRFHTYLSQIGVRTGLWQWGMTMHRLFDDRARPYILVDVKTNSEESSCAKKLFLYGFCLACLVTWTTSVFTLTNKVSSQILSPLTRFKERQFKRKKGHSTAQTTQKKRMSIITALTQSLFRL
jgi:hypothetical protein